MKALFSPFVSLISTTAFLVLLTAPVVADGTIDVVWDSPPNSDLPAFRDIQYVVANNVDFSTYLVAHVDITKTTQFFEITTYFSNFNNLWPKGQIEAVFNIIPQDGKLPPNSYDPSGPQLGGQGIKVLADMAMAGEHLKLTTNLDGDLVLQPGEYWFGLTPIIDFGLFGQEFHQGSDFFLKNTAGRNPGGEVGVGTDWVDAGQVFGGLDQWGMAVTITGKVIPEPSSTALLGVCLIAGSMRRGRNGGETGKVQFH